MKSGMFRLRRVAVAAISAVMVVAGAAVLLPQAASAATPTSVIAASSAPVVYPGGSSQAGGTWTISMASGETIVNAETVTVEVLDSSGACGLFFQTPPSVAVSGLNASVNTVTVKADGTKCTGADTNEVQITLSGVGGLLASAGTITITTPSYAVLAAAAAGNIEVGAADSASDPFTDTGNVALNTAAAPTPVATVAANATVVTAVTVGVSAVAQPTVAASGTNQAAGNWTITISGGSTSDGWTTGETIDLEVLDNAGANCTSKGFNENDTIAFNAAPTIGAPTLGSGQSSSPTFSAATIQPDGTACTSTSGVNDEAVLTFSNSGTIQDTTTTAVTFTVSAVAYNLSAYVAPGAVALTSKYLGVAIHTAATTEADGSNAIVSSVIVTANVPPVTLEPGALDAAISPIALTESLPYSAVNGTGVKPGWVCATLVPNAGVANFDSKSTPAVAVTPTGDAVAGTAAYTKVTNTNDTVAFDVTTPSSTTAVAYTLSGLAVDLSGINVTTVTLTVVMGATSSSCTGGTTITTATLAPFSILGDEPIFGVTADDTAASEFEAAWPACPGGKGSTSNATGGTYLAPAVLVTDGTYPDALSASYLAGNLATGILLTPTGSLSAAAIGALRVEGIGEVFVVGGPDAVSQNVINQLEALQVYECGGTEPLLTTVGAPLMMRVTQIYGQTQYDTAQAVATYPGLKVGASTFPGAYGKYNDTTGMSSASAASNLALRTAVLATGENFPDAMSASGMAYAEDYPVLLTEPGALSPQAEIALVDLGIQQVILMGGPDAVSDTVESTLTGLGFSVLRIAGEDYTDTAVQLADFELNFETSTGAADGLNWADCTSTTSCHPSGELALARGDFYADALAGSDITGKFIPLILTENPTTLGTYTTALLNAAGSGKGTGATATGGIDGLGAFGNIGFLFVFGGPLAVATTTITSALNAIAAG